jgi:hypothetical protein
LLVREPLLERSDLDEAELAPTFELHDGGLVAGDDEGVLAIDIGDRSVEVFFYLLPRLMNLSLDVGLASVLFAVLEYGTSGVTAVEAGVDDGCIGDAPAQRLGDEREQKLAATGIASSILKVEKRSQHLRQLCSAARFGVWRRGFFAVRFSVEVGNDCVHHRVDVALGRCRGMPRGPSSSDRRDR